MSPEARQLAEDLENFMQEHPDEDPAKFLAFWMLMHIGGIFLIFLVGVAIVTLFIHLYYTFFG